MDHEHYQEKARASISRFEAVARLADSPVPRHTKARHVITGVGCLNVVPVLPSEIMHLHVKSVAPAGMMPKTVLPSASPLGHHHALGKKRRRNIPAPKNVLPSGKWLLRALRICSHTNEQEENRNEANDAPANMPNSSVPENATNQPPEFHLDFGRRGSLA
jgi:hypothetical protein